MARMEQAPTQDRANELVEQARALRERGDTLTALTRLREAQAVSPDHPQIISEMAITYEKMGQAEKAAEQWQRIYRMGESAGIYYAAAEAKLKATGAAQQSQTGTSAASGTLGTAGTAQPAAGGTSGGGTAADASKDADGFQPGCTLALAEVTREEVEDPSSQTHFTVKIPVKSRAGTKIDVHDVFIQVFFYDLLDNQSVVQTNAIVSYRWTTPPTDWADDNMEILEADYALPRPDVRDTSRPIENRRYYGYTVRIYYKKQLQDMRADPIRLLQQFPPPVTLSTDAH